MINRTIIEILCTIAIFQSMLIAFYLFIQKRGTRKSRLILSTILVVFAVFVLGTFLLLISARRDLRFSGHIMNLTIFLVAPLLFFYFNSSMSPGFSLGRKEWIHFLPFLLIFLLMFDKIIIQRKADFIFKPYGIFLLGFLYAQNIAYLYIISSRRKRLDPARVDKSKFKWFDFVMKSFLVLFLVKLVIFIVWNILRYVDICVFITNIFFIISFIIINTIILYALHNPDLILGTIKYQYSPIAPSLQKRKAGELENLMKSKQLFMDPLISLKKVAGCLRISDKHLSQLVNEVYGLNFNEYINKHRVEKAKILMRDKHGKGKNILVIAYEVGFNSKTTFNTAFKKFTGIIPSEFRRGK